MRTRKAAPAPGSCLGGLSESLACRFLERRGLALVARNWRSRFGELDLVFREGETIVFVEVRLRTRATHGGAAESIDRRKRARLLASARLFMAGRPERPCRFDVILMSGTEATDLEWIRNAISE